MLGDHGGEAREETILAMEGKRGDHTSHGS